MNPKVQNILIALIVLGVINLIGYLFHANYIGAVIGSAVGMIVGFFISEIRAKFD